MLVRNRALRAAVVGASQEDGPQPLAAAFAILLIAAEKNSRPVPGRKERLPNVNVIVRPSQALRQRNCRAGAKEHQPLLEPKRCQETGGGWVDNSVPMLRVLPATAAGGVTR